MILHQFHFVYFEFEDYLLLPINTIKKQDGKPYVVYTPFYNEFIKNKGDTAYHPCGTCKMGKDNTSVVNEKLQVYGVENLRVVDASIMPKIITGNLNATTVMIAEKASDYILGKSLKTNNVEFFRAG